MGRRTIAILIFVVGIIILAVVIGTLLLSGGDEPTTVEGDGDVPVAEDGEIPPGDVPQVELTLGPTITVFVSLNTIPRGFRYPFTEDELLSQGLVSIDERFTDSVSKDAITDVNDIFGRYARNPIFQGETLTQDALADDPTLIGIEKAGPSSLIPEGSIAAAIPMDRLSGVAYGLDEGDLVDIMITFLFYQIDEEFQTYLQNEGVFILQDSFAGTEAVTDGTGEEVAAAPEVFVISPYGRFEQLPNGDLAHISPSEFQRPVPIAMIVQKATVIQVGAWKPPALAQPPTPVPTAVPEDAEVTPTPFTQVTPIAEPPDVLVVALTPQQQLLMKYAVETNADIDFALRGFDVLGNPDTTDYTVENVNLEFILQRFGFELPPELGISLDIPASDTAEPTPEAGGEQGGSPPEGG
jgi:Flp pilus assembly protein CpaB